MIGEEEKFKEKPINLDLEATEDARLSIIWMEGSFEVFSMVDLSERLSIFWMEVTFEVSLMINLSDAE